MTETLLNSSISKAGMPFKFFNRKTSSPKQPSQFVPSTPKMPIGGRPNIPPVTPTLMDGSFKGEQRRAAVLEQQLREVSVTASKAYDTIDDLTTKNEMLQEQVNQQKILIESFTKQVEDLKNEKLEFKRLQDDEIKEKLVEKSKDSEEISQLRHEKDMLKIDNEALQDEILKLKNMYNEMSRSMMNREEKSSAQNLVKLSSSKEEEYKEFIQTLEDKIEELEDLIHSKTQKYEKSISALQSSIGVLNDSTTFLNDRGNSTTKNALIYKDDVDYGISKDEGDTFVLSNLSFLP